jgi:hypothetical protein
MSTVFMISSSFNTLGEQCVVVEFDCMDLIAALSFGSDDAANVIIYEEVSLLVMHLPRVTFGMM